MALSDEARARLLNLLGSLQTLPTATTTSTTDTTNLINNLLNTNTISTALPTDVINSVLNTPTSTATVPLNTTTSTAATNLLNNILADFLVLRLRPSLRALRNDLLNRLNQTVQLSTSYETLTGTLIAVESDYVVLVKSDGSMNFVNLTTIETVASL
ncbi:UNVERIFIED_ORG: hypothetical protein J2X74_005479 [Bacillus sp. 1751]|nr:hypothetical protein [Bacillus sp. 1751]